MTRREVLLGGTALTAAGCSLRTRSPVALRLANWGGASDDSDYDRLVSRLYRTFERETGLRLKIEKIPGSQEYVTKLLLAHISGSIPDIVVLDASSAAAFVDNGVLLDLAPFAARDPDFDIGAFWPNVVSIAKRGAQIFAIPADFTPMVMYVNRRHFAEAGLSLPHEGWSFDEFLAAGRTLTRNGRFGFEWPNWMPGWLPWLWNAGGDVLSADGSHAHGAFDAPQSVAALQFLADLVLRHAIAPSLSQIAATGVDFFAEGRASMKVNGHWALVGATAPTGLPPADIAIVPLPSADGRLSETVMYEAGLAIGKECRHPEDAWRFIRYWTSRRVQEPYNASGIAVCARMDVAKSLAARPPVYRDPSGTVRPATSHELEAHREREDAFLRISPTARPPWGARVEGYDIVEQIGQKALDGVLKNGQSVDAAARQAAYEIDRELSRR